MKIGVFGNTRLGLPAIQLLLQNNLQISLVLPNRPSDETDHLEQMAISYGVAVKRIDKQSSGKEITKWFENEKPDLVVVLTFPYIIPAGVLEKGTPWFNFHYAPLPAYRGAEPTFWQIKNKEKTGAVTVHLITRKLDAGPVVFEDPVPIDENDTHGMHLTKLAFTGASSLLKLLQMWQQNGGKISGTQQDEANAKTYPRVGLQDLIIRWKGMTAADIRALVNAGNPWNKGAITFLEGKPLRITAVTIEKAMQRNAREPGSLIVDSEGNLRAQTNQETDLVLDVISVDEGIYTGREFAKQYDLNNKILSEYFSGT
ncbi:MAG: methionyl-tRNA formyltransferase [Owenweeksia sp.]